MNCLLDAGPIVALAMPEDDYHQEARRFSRSSQLRLHTTSVAAGEAYTFLRRRANYRIATESVRNLRFSSVTTIHFLDEELEASTWAIMEEFAGVPLSYVDATLIALGRRLRVNRIFAFDDAFAQAGMIVVPDHSPAS